MSDIKEELLEFIQTQMSQAEFRLHGNIVDDDGKPYPRRRAFGDVQKYIESFVARRSEPRWIVMPGLRGVGKTTLLSQLFLNAIPNENVYKFYLSVDEVVRRFQASLWDVVEAFEGIIGKRLERLDKKLFLFFDEIQYDRNWDAAVKSFYDRTKNVFIFCTGSSAMLLRKQLSADSARRAYFHDLCPMSFVEYIEIERSKYIEEGKSEKIRESLFNSSSAKDCFNKLRGSEPAMKEYWAGLDKLEIDRYIKFGTMPFSLVHTDDAVVLNNLEQMLQKIIYSDIPSISNFDKETLNKIYTLVYLLSDSLDISLTNLSGTLEASKDTLALMLAALEDAGLIQRVAPHGSHYKQVRKPYKNLFTTPAFRFLQLSSKRSITHYDKYKGELLEDVIGLYLQRIGRGYRDVSITYDSAKEGADFIFRCGKQRIVLEIGYGDKGVNQAIYSLRRTKSKYGVVVGGFDEVSMQDSVVKIPLRYFLLV